MNRLVIIARIAEPTGWLEHFNSTGDYFWRRTRRAGRYDRFLRLSALRQKISRLANAYAVFQTP
jgi:hypothetical protein